MSDDVLTDLIAQHPRLAGVLFAALLVLSTAAPALAGTTGKFGP